MTIRNIHYIKTCILRPTSLNNEKGYTHFGTFHFDISWLYRQFSWCYSLFEGSPIKYLIIGIHCHSEFIVNEKHPNGYIKYRLQLYKPAKDKDRWLFKRAKTDSALLLSKGLSATFGRLHESKVKGNKTGSHFGFLVFEVNERLIELVKERKELHQLTVYINMKGATIGYYLNPYVKWKEVKPITGQGSISS
jgi:hypothetical protein